MVQGRTFGRRAATRPAPRPSQSAATPVSSVLPDAAATQPPQVYPGSAEGDIDHELLAWKRARRKNFQIPWRQLALMAGLCFGVASFVLPDAVNDDVQWLLYGLMAASFYAGLRKRKKPSG